MKKQKTSEWKLIPYDPNPDKCKTGECGCMKCRIDRQLLNKEIEWSVGYTMLACSCATDWGK